MGGTTWRKNTEESQCVDNRQFQWIKNKKQWFVGMDVVKWTSDWDEEDTA